MILKDVGDHNQGRPGTALQTVSLQLWKMEKGLDENLRKFSDVRLVGCLVISIGVVYLCFGV